MVVEIPQKVSGEHKSVSKERGEKPMFSEDIIKNFIPRNEPKDGSKALFSTKCTLDSPSSQNEADCVALREDTQRKLSFNINRDSSNCSESVNRKEKVSPNGSKTFTVDRTEELELKHLCGQRNTSLSTDANCSTEIVNGLGASTSESVTPRTLSSHSAKRHSETRPSSANMHLDPSNNHNKLHAATGHIASSWKPRQFSMFRRTNVSSRTYLNSHEIDSKSGRLSSSPHSGNGEKNISLMGTLYYQKSLFNF